MATKKQKVTNVPNLRFPGFEGEWVAKKFGEVATNKSGKYNPTSARSSIKCIELEHLVSESGQLIGYIDGSRSGSIKNIFSKGDVLFGKLRPYLRKYLQAPFDGACSSEIWVLKGKGVLNDFLYQIVQTDKFIDLANQSSGSKMPRADWSVVEKGNFSFPTITEQQKISRFLSLLDSRIATQNKIIDYLESSMLILREKLLTQILRFRDRNGTAFQDWEMRKLGDIGHTYNGLSGKSKEDFGSGKSYIQYKQIFDSSMIEIQKCGLVEVSSNENQNAVMYGDIFFTISSETPHEIGMSSVLLSEVQEMYLNSFCFGYRPISQEILNPFFARYLFRSAVFRNEIVKLAQGSTRYNMSKTQLMKLEIALPSIEEQKNIAKFLSSLDQKIDAEKNILYRYKAQKKYLIEKLFV